MSERDRAAVRQRLAFEKAELEKQRLDEDRTEYAKYRKTFEQEQAGLPPAYRVDPLGFATWRSYAPDDQPNSELRGATATNRALQRRAVREIAEQVRNGKDPDCYVDPQTAGPEHAMTEEAARRYNGEQAKLSRQQLPWWYGSEANKAALLAYFERNDLQVITAEMLRRAAERLREFGLLEERPEPQPEQNANLGIEPDPEMEREQRLRAYYETPVATDPLTGENFSEAQLDRMGADQYRRLIFGERFVPTIGHALKPSR